MIRLKIINDSISCETCVSTKQMKASDCCTNSIIKANEQFLPECFININTKSQAERNYLTCPTYNLGLFIVCQSCPLDCIKNPNQKQKSPLGDIVNLLGGLFGIDESKKKDIDKAFEKLNEPEFKDVYNALTRASNAIKDVMESKPGASDMTKKVLEVESINLKNAFGDLIKNGKIGEDEARLLTAEINSERNINKLKSVLDTMKKQFNAKA